MARQAAGAAAMVGKWFQPRPIVLISGKEPGSVRSEVGDVKLVLTNEVKEGKMRRVVTLTDAADGFTMTGCANVRYDRVRWDNGAIWAKEVAPAAVPEDCKNGASKDVVVHDEPENRAALGGCGAAFDEEDNNAPPVCCSIFGGGRSKPSPPSSSAPAPERPPQARPGRVLPIEIISARGLKSADWGSANDVFVKCELQDKPGSISFRTPVVESEKPVWNHCDKLEDYAIGDTIVFTLWDRDTFKHDPLGKVVMRSDQFHPNGFEGEVKVECAGKAEAFLTIDIAPESEITGRQRLLSEAQVQNIVDRVNEVWDVALLTESMEGAILHAAVSTANRRLRRALLSFCGRGWVNALQIVMDNNTEKEKKSRMVSACLRECLSHPLAQALTDFMLPPKSFLQSSVLKVNKLIVKNLVEELVEAVTDGLEDIGLLVSADVDEQ